MHTEELQVLKHDEAMTMPAKKEWEITVDKEHKWMEKHEVFKAVPVDEVPANA